LYSFDDNRKYSLVKSSINPSDPMTIAEAIVEIERGYEVYRVYKQIENKL